MMTKEQFEAHVRAEADRAVPVVRLKHPTLKHHSFDLSEGARKLYIAARMEHEWPLVEALQASARSVSDLHNFIRNYFPQSEVEKLSPRDFNIVFGSDGHMQRAGDAVDKVRAAISPYTTKPAQP